MKTLILISIAVLITSNQSFAEAFSADCSVRGLNLETNQFLKGSNFQPRSVTLDENESLYFTEMGGYAFEARNSGTEIQATAISKSTGDVINPVIVDGSQYSILSIKSGKIQITMDCTKLK